MHAARRKWVRRMRRADKLDGVARENFLSRFDPKKIEKHLKAVAQ